MNKVLLEYISNNKKSFIKLLLFLLIGILLGVTYFNLFLKTDEKNIINNYIVDTYDLIKANENINFSKMFLESIKRNFSYIGIIGICGLFIIGNIFIYIVLIIKGITFVFTISSVLSAFGMSFKFWIFILNLILQNIIMIPCIILISEKSIKLYKIIINKLSNKKEELCKHIIIMLILFLLCFVSSLIEIYISINFLIAF